MPFEFKIIPENQIETVVPLVLKMSKPSITEAVLLNVSKKWSLKIMSVLASMMMEF